MYALNILEQRYEVFASSDHVGSTAQLERSNGVYGIVIRLRNGNDYIIEDEDG